ncbi:MULTISPECIES: acetate--CoA ligase [Streptomyces]|uniref:Acetyl-coenzyme A synthetase n=1 Tax=Streptomyces rimosus subsp. rimosus (strain ATCC 10970 / DSM 40260 / JCM 4667 / NRRL 2234) TaxID=1265868 RepID=L8EU66_STRR1|nr:MULTISPECIES: acetate--CoA ligase [Streptomyces]KOG70484.1 acetyl-CoA synthetase [Kitasatospora aureofaciens]MYT43469.1 acetate--CoA ligase [Streptomyces sp. SID5471]KUJ29298.1 acetyl-coenzyme A synthetase [Streptomyces rimosus subsp. rimosus]QDA05330.1 acetate--CoA ligase [Streptomyces rimosus]QEV80903.1 acetate--CoA ligase [Streptomyces rimosus]
MSNESLANLLKEERRFAPPAELAANANVTAEAYERAAADRLGFWATQAKRLTWASEPTETLDWSNPPFAKWFADGKLNVAYNCVDRHVENGLGDRVAIHFEGEPGDTRAITYAELQREVSQAANALTELGVVAGDRVAIYLPMIPEAVIAMLACARLGAPHSVVFGGFSADALATRINDADARVVITADGGYRRGKPSALKPAVDEALTRPGTENVRSVLVVRRTGQEDVAWTEGRDVWWHEIVGRQSETHTPEAFDAEHPLFILYTSGTTGKPKGILHTTGGYLTQVAYTHHAVFDLKPETDVYWCTADVGWVTGHSYITYGPLANGATEVLYEGTPDTPHQGRWWEIVQKYGVTILYTAPTAIRACMKWGDDIPAKYDLSSLRVLGSVGEPINPEAWMWYRKHIGADQAPIVDTWWQTETGGMMLSPLPGVTETKPGSAQRPLPGIAATVVDDEAHEVPDGGGGYLVLTEPWPSMLRTIWGDDQRYLDTYWSRFQDKYFAGDGAKKDEDGDIWLLGRVDDVMLVSGHNISTTEVESALVSHPKVAEAAVVGAADPQTTQAICAFVILRGGAAEDEGLVEELRAHVAKQLGPIAKPKRIMPVAELPKTRSGKIMRRLLRDVAENRDLGDVTTLTDSTVMDLIQAKLPSASSED